MRFQTEIIMTIRYRQVQASDINAIMEIESDAFAAGVREDKALYLKRIRAFPEGFLVAEDTASGRIAGYICSELWNDGHPVSAQTLALGHDPEEAHDYGGTLFYITSFGTLKAYRGKGIGAALLDALEATVAEKFPNATRSALIVSEKWTAARHLYAKRGFKEKGRIIDFFTPDGLPAEDAVLMMKPD